MLEHPLLVAFARLIADFIGVPGNDPEFLKSVFAHCAQALLEGQEAASMRDTFEYERIQHFTTQYLTSEDRAELNDLLGNVGLGILPGQKSFQLFFREMPNRATWLRSSIPNWAFSAELSQTLGSLVNRDGRRFWVDLYKTAPDTKREVWMDGSNRPVLYLAPNEPLTSQVIAFPLGFPIIGVEMGEGFIWVQSKLFSPGTAEDLYCGLRVLGVSLTFPGMSPNNFRVIHHPRNQFIKSVLTIKLAPPLPAAANETPFGADARNAVVQFPEAIKISFTPSNTSFDEVMGAPEWTLYGDHKKFEWTGTQPTYNQTFNAVAVPMTLDSDKFVVEEGVQSPVLGLNGKAKATAAAWLLPAAKLATPLRAEGTGMLMIDTEAALNATFPGLLDVNQETVALLRPEKSLITVQPGLIQLMALQTATEYATQTFQLWQDSGKRWNTLRLHYKQQIPFVYQSSADGVETFATVGNCEGNLNRPVAADGQPFALQTKNSLCVRTYSALKDDVVIYDENILRDNLSTPALAGAASTFQSKAIALNNALLTISPINAFLLSGQLQPQANTFDTASLTYAFGLLGYLPTLPDPYAANTGVFKWMVEQRQGNNGAYTLDQIGHLLVGAMQWQAAEAPAVRFIFGDLERMADNLPLSLNILQNLDLATRRAADDYTERSRKAAALVRRRTGQELNSWNHEYDINIHINDTYQNRHFFSLLDVSTAADWMGVNLGAMDERLIFERTFEVVPDQNPLSAKGMDVVATGRFVRLFTAPQISWEPLINITPVVNANNDPPAGVLMFKDDGPPTLIGNTGRDTVPIAPLPLAHYLEENYRKNADFKAWSFFTLPFGILGVARYDQKGMGAGAPPGAAIELVQHQFEGGAQTSLQISTTGYLNPIQSNRNFEGATEQLYNLHGADGSPLNRSILTKTVTEIFNGEFGTNGNDGKLRQRGVPVERYDFSGYGANIFSNWLNAQAKIGQTSQAKFDVWRGRTAHEVIQVRSIVYPWGIRVVRTITMFRESTGLVYRVDSGWRAESDGVYNFRTELITGKNAQGQDIVVLETDGFEFHSGVVKGVFEVRNIVESEDISPFLKAWNKITGYYIDPNDGLPKSVGAGKPLSVNLIPVYFDADVQIEGVVQGGTNGRVPSKRMLGFLQIGPQGIPISPEDFARLLQENKGLGGPVDCLVNIAESNQTMRINRVEVQPSRDAANKLVFVTAAKGAPVLPKDGSWSVVMHKKASGEVLPLISSGVPLIRRGIHGVASNSPFELADPVDLFNLNLEDRATQFAFLQNTDTQKVLFRNPFFELGKTILQSSPPDLADAYRLLDSKGIFPKVVGLPSINLTNFNLNIVEEGYKLAHETLPETILEHVLPEGPIYFVNEKDVKIYVEYAKKDILGNKLGEGKLSFGLDSSAGTWANKLNDVTMVVDLLDMKRLFLIRGKFDTEKGKAPSFTGPVLEFGEKLQPVYEILQILSLLNGGNYAAALTKGLKIAMSNSPNNWEYKFQADKEIPTLRFPPPAVDSAIAPLRLECYLKLGCYFNVGMPLPPGEGLPAPSAGGYVEFGAKLSVMCLSVAAATVYAVGTCALRIGADTVNGPNLYMKMGFGVELMVGLPVIGSVSVYFGAGIEIFIDKRLVTVSAFILFRGRAELIGGLVTIQIQIEAKGTIAARIGERTDCVAQVTFSLDISIFLVINISFTESFQENRQIA
ncbi:MAG: hypothetical protein SH848_08930 [Saprospiraceae bacterium]|nr:hypothetical protein [Saprospiraceae bacterium]MDZ4704041.1 hypothetical protein [Saprospiraceae bacterium]